MDKTGSCDHILHKLELYSDGELSLSDQQELESHLEYCESCHNANQELKLLKKTLHRTLSLHAPCGLKRKIRQSLRQLTKEDKQKSSRLFSWLGIGGGLVSIITLTVWFIGLTTAFQKSPLKKEIIAAHIRSLQVDHLSDVRSSDKHAVKPWFSSKIDFSPLIFDLSSKGFNLAGGRLDYIAGRNVAAVIYKKRQHIINLFMWPAINNRPTIINAQHNGYNLIAWTSKEMNYWLVSDLNLRELSLLSRILKIKQRVTSQ